MLCGGVAACCQAQYKLPDDGRKPKHVEATFLRILM
jgi:hypothetical protein